MARAQDPGSANSQFFIVFNDASFLDGQYTVWGQVIEGMELVDNITRGEPPQDTVRQSFYSMPSANDEAPEREKSHLQCPPYLIKNQALRQ